MISPFIPMLGDYFLKTVEISFHASLIIGVLLVIRPLIKRFLPPRWVYALWFIVVVRLLLVEVPSLPEATIPSFQNALTTVQSVNGEDSPIPSAVLAYASAPSPGSFAITWPETLAVVWLIGAVCLLFHFGMGTFRWSRRLARAPAVQEPEIRRLLEECRREMGVRTVRLVQLPGFASPSMTGLFRPVIVLPEDFLERFGPKELRWILLHELAHLKRWDLPVQFLCQILQAIHWFNPLVWLAFSCFRCDRELACDAHVLDRQAPTTPRDYGHALIKVAEIYPRSVFSPGFLGISEEKTDLHERVEKIGTHRRPAPRWIVSGVILCVLLVIVFLTRQAAPAHQATAKIQVYKSNSYVPAEIEVIQSEDIVVPAIIGLGLDKVWAQRFGSNENVLTPAEIMDRVSKILTVKIRPDADDIVYVTVQGDMPREDTNIANAIVNEYVNKRRGQALQDASSSAQQNYDGTIADLEANLATSKANLEKWRQQTRGASSPPSPAVQAQFQAGEARAQAQIDQMQKTLERTKAQMDHQISDNTAQNTGVRILAPAY
jgi:bla regulator protein BlaR1